MSGVLRTQLARRIVGEINVRPLGTRGFAADHHGPPKVNFWEKPTEPAEWKAEQTVLIILGTWGVVIKGAMTYFGK